MNGEVIVVVSEVESELTPRRGVNRGTAVGGSRFGGRGGGAGGGGRGLLPPLPGSTHLTITGERIQRDDWGPEVWRVPELTSILLAG